MRGLYYFSKVGLFYAIVATLALSQFQNCSQNQFALYDLSSQAKGNLFPLTEQQPSNSESLVTSIFSLRSVEAPSSTNPCTIEGLGPLLTHYPTSSGTETPSLYNENAAQEIASGAWFPLKYSAKLPNYRPSVNNYIGNNFDTAVGAESDVRSILSRLCFDQIQSVRLKQPVEPVTTGSALSQLIEVNKPYFQVIHSIVFKNNLFTLVIPPNFSRIDRNYSTLVNGLYSLNDNLLRGEGSVLFEISKESFRATQVGFIGIMWNGGGAIGSRTFNEQAYIDFDQFIKIYLEATGARSDRFASFGASRGGITALSLAASPRVTSAQFSYVDAGVPAFEVNQVARLASVTVPLLLEATDWSVGYIGSWHPNFKVTSNGISMSGPMAHANVLAGSIDDPSFINKHNLLTATKIAKLKAQGTNIFLEVGSHDYIVPWVDQFKLFKYALSSDLNVEVQVNYLYGHGINVPARTDRLIRVMNALAVLGNSNGTIKKRTIKAFVADDTHQLREITAVQLPITIEVPKYFVDEIPSPFIVTGPSQQRLAMVWERADAAPWIVYVQTNNLGTAIVYPNLSTIPDGNYALKSIFALDLSGRPTQKWLYRNTLAIDAPTEIIRYRGPIGQEAVNIAGKILTAYSTKGDLTYPKTSPGVNLGVLVTGSTTVSTEELSLFGFTQSSSGSTGSSGGSPSESSSPQPTSTPTMTQTPSASSTPTSTIPDPPIATAQIVKDSDIKCLPPSDAQIPVSKNLKYFGIFGSFGADIASFDQWKTDAIATMKMGNTQVISFVPLNNDPGNAKALAFFEAQLRFLSQYNMAVMLALQPLFFDDNGQLKSNHVTTWNQLVQKMTPYKASIKAIYPFDEPFWNVELARRSGKTNYVNATTMDNNLTKVGNLIHTTLPGVAVAFIEAFPMINASMKIPSVFDWIGMDCYTGFANCEGQSIPAYYQILKTLQPNKKLIVLPPAMVFKRASEITMVDRTSVKNWFLDYMNWITNEPNVIASLSFIYRYEQTAEVISGAKSLCESADIHRLFWRKFQRLQSQSMANPVFTCPSSGSLQSLDMSGTFQVSAYDKGLSGHYFIAGWDPNEQKWWSYNQAEGWVQYNGSENTIRSTPTTNLQDRGPIPIFAKSNLIDFPLAKIYLGYGLGATKMEAWNNMMSNASQYAQCGTFPDLPTPKCQITVAANGNANDPFVAIPNTGISIESGKSSYFKISSTNASEVQVNCGSGWVAFTPDSSGKQLIGPFSQSLNCSLRGIFKNSKGVIAKTNPCEPAQTTISVFTRPDTMNCPITGSLTAKNMTAAITVGTVNQSQAGYYFIAARVPAENKLYLFKGGSWTPYDGTTASLVGYASAGNLKEFSQAVFSNSNLTAYKGAEVFIGYGVGNTIGSAFNEMMGVTPTPRYKSCGTIQ